MKHTKFPFNIDDQPSFAAPREPLIGTPNFSEPSTFANQEHGVLVAGDFNFGEGGAVYERFFDSFELLTAVLAHELPHRDVLVGSRNFSPRGDLDLVIIDATAFDGADLSALLGQPDGYKTTMSLPLMLCDDAWPNAGYHRPEDVIARDGDVAVVRAGIEDLMASFGKDGDGDAAIVVKPDMRDFAQLTRTRSNDLERIEQAVAAANALGIDTSNVASKRDAALARLVVFSDRFETGGTHEVTEAEATVINEVFGELWSIHSDLDTQVSHWHHYKQHQANHDRWEARLADRKRNFKVAEGAEDNRIAQMYIGYAASPEETLAASKAAFVELFQAIQRGDLRAAHEADTRARHFSTREHMLDALIRRGKLVVVEDSATA